MKSLQNLETLQIEKIQKKLLSWYRHHRRALPWRRNPTPYRVWISEVMLQQTRSNTVIRYYSRFLKRFPDIQSLARASEQEVLKFWSGLGYYSRARNLHRSAKHIVKVHRVFPRDFNSMLSLPGIGPYTAGAICSIAFNQAQPLVDGNIRRVITRLHGIRKRPPDSYFWNQMRAWIPEKEASSFNQAMMELGALVCAPHRPRCPQCPIRNICKARKMGIENSIPRSRSRQAWNHVTIAVLVIQHNGKTLLTTRNKHDFIPGKWGLPYLPVMDGTLPEAVASRFCRKIIGHEIPLLPCTSLRHSITRYRIRVFGFYGRELLPTYRLDGNDCYLWVGPSSLGTLLTSSLFYKVLKKFQIQA